MKYTSTDKQNLHPISIELFVNPIAICGPNKEIIHIDNWEHVVCEYYFVKRENNSRLTRHKNPIKNYVLVV